MSQRQRLAAIALLGTIIQTAAAAATMQPIWLAGALGFWLFVYLCPEPDIDQDQE